MDESDNMIRTPPRGKAWQLAVGLPALLMLYILSIGPVVMLDNFDAISYSMLDFLEAFYSPVVYIGRSEIPVVSPLTNSYIDWWVTLAPIR